MCQILKLKLRKWNQTSPRTQFSVPGFAGYLFGWGLSPLAGDFLKKSGKAASRRSSVDRAAHGSTVAFVVIVHSVAPSEPVVLP